MDVKLTVTKTLDDNIWGFSDMLEGFDDVSPDERRTMIIEYIRDVDPWEAVDPDDGAIWTVSIDGDEPDWQARAEAAEERRDDYAKSYAMACDGRDKWRIRAEAAERRVAELEAQLAAHAWRPVTEKPSQAGYYQTVNDGIYEHCYYGPNGWEDYYLTPTHWRPLTDPPLTGES